MVFTAGDCVLLYDGLHTPLVSPLHIVQTFLCPDVVIYSNAAKHCVLAERDIVQWHSVKKLKYADVGLNQWTGHIFALKVESRGSVAKSFRFSLQKLGLTQNAFIKLRKAVSLTVLDVIPSVCWGKMIFGDHGRPRVLGQQSVSVPKMKGIQQVNLFSMNPQMLSMDSMK